MLFSSGRSAPQWIICFLGNPGSQYARTRHNAGWIACELLEEETRIRTDRLKFHAFTGVGSFGGSSVLFMRPQTYMNLSGDAVQPAAAFYKIPPERVIVIQDDIALPPGKLRVKRGGSDGGHNGIKSITQRLGTQDYPRIKIGVGAPPAGGQEQIDWVLSVPRNQDWEDFSAACERAARAAEELITNGPETAMGKYN